MAHVRLLFGLPGDNEEHNIPAVRTKSQGAFRAARFGLPVDNEEQNVPAVRKQSLGAYRAARYRAQLKTKDPEAYCLMNIKAKERSKLWRDKPKTKEELERLRKMSCERTRKYRETHPTQCSSKSKVLTRKEREGKRAYWKLKKQESRGRLSAQKRRRIKEYDRNRKTLPVVDVSVQTPSSGQGYNTACARRKAASRARKRLPMSPKKYAEVIMKLIANATPRKRKALSDLGVHSPKKQRLTEETYTAVKASLQQLRGNRTKEARKKRQHLLNLSYKHWSDKRMACRELGLRWSYLQKASVLKEEEPRSDKISEKVEERVKDFYLRPEISITLPDAKYVRDGKSRHILQKTVRSVYQDFKKENPNTKIGQSKFACFRPTNVKPQTSHSMNECVCEYCANLELKLKTAKCICTSHNEQELKIMLQDRYSATKATMCEKTDTYEERACLERECIECGSSLLKNQMKPLTKCKDVVSWHEWRMIEREKQGKKTKRMGLAKITGTVELLVKEICKEVDFMVMHLFNASWQLHQFQKISTNVPDNWLVCVLDFGQNYNCFYQDSAQATYWAQEQVTVHPVVCYYSCPVHKVTVKEEVVCLSPDRIHDSHAVRTFLEATREHLITNRKLSIEYEVQWSDGCSSQYKSKNPFQDIAESDIPLMRSFFGSRHGKGPCDGVTGVVKRTVRNAVKARAAIVSDPESMFEYCSNNLTRDNDVDDNTGELKCEHKRRTFLFIEDIDRNKTYEANTVVGTRKLHCVGNANMSDLIISRNLSCFCPGCLQDGGKCENEKYVDPFIKVSLKTGRESTDSSSQRGRHNIKGKSPRTNPPRSKSSSSTSQEMETTGNGRKTRSQSSRLARSTIAQMKEDAPPLSMPTRANPPRSTSSSSTSRKRETTGNGRKTRPQSSRLARSTIYQMKEDAPPLSMPTSTNTDSKQDDTHRVDEVDLPKIMPHKKRYTSRLMPSKMPVPFPDQDDSAVNKDADRTALFEGILQELQAMKSFEGLQMKCTQYTAVLKRYPFSGSASHSVVSTGLPVDKVAHGLWPTDVPSDDMVMLPVCVSADGNCLPRAGSVLATGKQEHHAEVRVRMVEEIALNEDVYLNTKHLVKGSGIRGNMTSKVLNSFVMYSENFVTGNKIAPAYARRILRQDVLDLIKNCQYVTAWQLFALASILKCPLHCVYPQRGNPIVRKDLNRVLYPRVQSSDQELYLMWTSTRNDDMTDTHWVPNHFVPVLPVLPVLPVSCKNPALAVTDEDVADIEPSLDLSFQMEPYMEADIDELFQELNYECLELQNDDTVPEQDNDIAPEENDIKAPEEDDDKAKEGDDEKVPEQNNDIASKENYDKAPEEDDDTAQEQDNDKAPEEDDDKAPEQDDDTVPEENDIAPVENDDKALEEDDNKAPEQDDDKAPEQDNDIAPEENDDKAPEQDYDKAPEQYNDIAPEENDDKAPEEDDDDKAPEVDDKAPEQDNDKAPEEENDDKALEDDVDEAREQDEDTVPEENDDKAPEQYNDIAPEENDIAPVENDDKALEEDDNKAPEQDDDKAPEQYNDIAPEENDDKAPEEDDDDKAPEQYNDIAPEQDNDKAPEEEIYDKALEDDVDEAREQDEDTVPEENDDKAPEQYNDIAPEENDIAPVENDDKALEEDDNKAPEQDDDKAPEQDNDIAPEENDDKAPEQDDDKAPEQYNDIAPEKNDDKAPEEDDDDKAPEQYNDIAPEQDNDKAPEEEIDDKALEDDVDEAREQDEDTVPEENDDKAPEQYNDIAPEENDIAPVENDDKALEEDDNKAPEQDDDKAPEQDNDIAPEENDDKAPEQDDDKAPEQYNDIAPEEKDDKAPEEEDDDKAPEVDDNKAPEQDNDKAPEEEIDDKALEDDVDEAREQDEDTVPEENDDKAPEQYNDIAPEENDIAPVENDDKALEEDDNKAQEQDDDKAPEQDNDIAPEENDDKAPEQDDDTVQEENDDKAPEEDDDKAPEEIDDTVPEGDDYKAPEQYNDIAPEENDDKAPVEDDDDKAPEVDDDKAPEQDNDKAPEEENDDKAPEDDVDEAPEQDEDTVPEENDDKAPEQCNDIAPEENDIAPVENDDKALEEDDNKAPELEEDDNKAPEQDDDKAPEQDNDIAPEENDDKAPEQDDDKAPEQYNDIAPEENDDKAPEQDNDIAPEENDDKAPEQDNDIAPEENDDKAPEQDDDKAPEQYNDIAPEENDDKAPEQDNDIAPVENDDKALEEDDNKAPEQDDDKAPEQDDDKAPEQDNDTVQEENDDKAPEQDDDNVREEDDDTVPEGDDDKAPEQDNDITPEQDNNIAQVEDTIASDDQTSPDNTSVNKLFDDSTHAKQKPASQPPLDDQIAPDNQTLNTPGLKADNEYQIGHFIIGNCGSNKIPCLVVQTPPGMQSLPEVGLWVQFFKKVNRSLWVLEDKPFFMDYKNILEQLEAPSVSVAGARVYYKMCIK